MPYRPREVKTVTVDVVVALIDEYYNFVYLSLYTAGRGDQADDGVVSRTWLAGPTTEAMPSVALVLLAARPRRVVDERGGRG